MTTFAKSLQIAQLDQSVFTSTHRLNKGQGGAAYLYRASALAVTQSATDATTIFYRMVRLPATATVVSLKMMVDLRSLTYGGAAVTLTTFTINVGLFAADTPANDITGAPQPVQYATTALSDSFFAYNYDRHSTLVNTWTDLTFQNASIGGNSVTDGYYNSMSSVYPLWDAVQNGGYGRVAIAGYNTPTQGNGYSSGTTAPWTSPANSGTILTTPGPSPNLVDIGFRSSTPMSASGLFIVGMQVDYLL